MVKLRCPYLHSFGHTPRPPVPVASTICPARPVWYRVQTGAACPASGRLCLALHCMVCPGTCPALVFGTACAAACAVQSFRVRWGWGLHRRGIQGAPGVGQVMPAHSEANKKGVFPVSPPPGSCATHPHPHGPAPKFRRKNKKTPTKGLCSVLYLPYKP